MTSSTAKTEKPHYLLLLGVFTLLALLFYLGHTDFPRLRSVGDNYTYELLAQTVFSKTPFKINVKFDYFDEHPIYHHERSFLPLFPIVLAAAHAVFGRSPYVNVVLNSLIGISLSFVVYYLGLIWLKDPLASFLASLATIFSFSLINSSILGLSEPLFMLNSLLSLYFIYRYVYNGYQPGLVFAGLFSGLAYLTRTNGLAVVIALCFFLLLQRERPKKGYYKLTDTLIYLGVAVFVISPWFFRNWAVFGDPFYYVGRFSAGIEPGLHYSNYYSEPPTLGRFLKNATLFEILSRYLSKIPQIVSFLFKETHVLLLLSLGGAWVLLQKGRPLLVFFLFFLFNFIFILLHPNLKFRYIIPLIPLIYLGGAFYLSGKIQEFWPKVTRQQPLFLGSLLVTVGLYAFFYVSPRLTKEQPYMVLYKEAGEWLQANSHPDAVIMAELTPDVAYYSKRPVIMNPRNLEAWELDVLVKKYKIAYFIYQKTYIRGTIAPTNFKPVRPFNLERNGEKYQLVLFKNRLLS